MLISEGGKRIVRDPLENSLNMRRIARIGRSAAIFVSRARGLVLRHVGQMCLDRRSCGIAEDGRQTGAPVGDNRSRFTDLPLYLPWFVAIVEMADAMIRRWRPHRRGRGLPGPGAGTARLQASHLMRLRLSCMGYPPVAVCGAPAGSFGGWLVEGDRANSMEQSGKKNRMCFLRVFAMWIRVWISGAVVPLS